MAVRATVGLKPEWFTPSDQTEEEEPTRYELQPLNGMQMMAVMHHGEHDGEAFYPDFEGRKHALRLGLKGWENMLDGDGEPLRFDRTLVDVIPAHHLVEISNRILEISALGEDERKNSPSQ